MEPVAVVALGGHALLPKGASPTVGRQFLAARRAMHAVLSVLDRGWGLVLTHGNGPQVGNIVLRSELARRQAYPIPLSVAVAESEGEIGYVIQQALYNALRGRRHPAPVATVLTQVLVDRGDPAFRHPTKPIGPYYADEEAARLKARGMPMALEPGRGWRRVVASPRPLRIIEAPVVRRLVEQGVVVVAAGGGGIPVCQRHGRLHGVDAVIDKDLASAVLARDMQAAYLIILTDVERVALDYGKLAQRDLDRLTVAEARARAAEGHFPPGSMGPKIEAAVQFLEGGGQEVLITTPAALPRALEGRAGTRIVP